MKIKRRTPVIGVRIAPLRFVTLDGTARRITRGGCVYLYPYPFSIWILSLSLSVVLFLSFSFCSQLTVPEAVNAYSCQCLHKYAFRLMRLW